MRAEDYAFMFEMEESYWWYVAMRQIVDTIAAPQLRNKHLQILDAGCGTGYNLKHYASAGHSTFGFDLAPEAIQNVQRRGIATMARASITDIPYRSGIFDLAISFDVMDELPPGGIDTAITELHRVLKPGGFILVRLPALEWLRSSHDTDIGTSHRFTTAELEHTLERAGFTVRFSTYANCFLLPVAVMRRLLKWFGIGKGTDTKPLPSGLAWLDPLFRHVLASEAAIIAHRRLPFGLSVIGYAQKAD